MEKCFFVVIFTKELKFPETRPFRTGLTEMKGCIKEYYNKETILQALQFNLLEQF